MERSDLIREVCLELSDYLDIEAFLFGIPSETLDKFLCIDFTTDFDSFKLLLEYANTFSDIEFENLVSEIYEVQQTKGTLLRKLFS